ncbi:GNAT family N-acetyltransferase [Paenibacillus sediminis]|nr:GNAT family N-acetyltransferase [Paenibacillus sediminis]
MAILKLKSMEPAMLNELSEMLINVVEDGASVGFLAPLRMKEAVEYWEQVISPGVMLWIAVMEEKIVGTIQLHLAMKANGSHRAEVAKLMVHPSYRRNGIARLLMQTVESAAKAEGRSLLILDTRLGDPSNELYKSLGYIEAGQIPNYAKSSNGHLDATVFYYKQI